MTDKTDSKERDGIISSSDILLHDAKTALMYEELRAAIDDGHESMTHADALAEIAAIRAENEQLQAQLASIGAGGVSGPLMGKPQEMPDLAALTERGAKAWAGVDAQGLRDGAASAGSEPVAHLWQHSETGRTRVVMPDMVVDACATWLLVGPLYLHPSPPEGMVMVPKEPTHHMLNAAASAYEDARQSLGAYNAPWAAYRAMLEVAAPPTSSADSRKGD